MAAASYRRISVIQRPKTNFMDFGSVCFGPISAFIHSPGRIRLPNQFMFTRNITCTTGRAERYPSPVLRKPTSTQDLSINTEVKQSLANSCSSQESASSRLYHYSPLQEPTSIRIFHLKPGEEGDPLRCTIEHINVNLSRMFSAISYVVGNEEMSHRILVGADQYIPLTASLHEALQNIRAIKDVEQRGFWADQICIGRNTQERNHQVSMMVAVYRKATQVITYIGPETSGDSEGIALVKTIHDLWLQARNSNPALGSTEVQHLLGSKLPGENDTSWDGFGSLIYREWSTRVWMIQENVVNENTVMLCGKIAFPLIIPSTAFLGVFADHFPERLKFAFHNGRDSCVLDSETLRVLPLPSFGQLLFLRAWIQENPSNSMNLLELLRIGSNFECKDIRDKVYALLGLASNTLEIEPDYDKSEAKVLTDTARRILRTSSNLDLLNHVGYTKEIKLPSWVPDWSLPKSRFFLDTRFKLTPEAEYCASANMTSAVDLDACDSVLGVYGAIIDSVRCCAGDPTISASRIAQEPDLILVEYPRMMEVIRKICEELNHQTSSDHIPVELLDPLSRTVTADRAVLRDLEDKNICTLYLAFLNICLYKYEMALSNRDRLQLPQQHDMTTHAEGLEFLNYSLIAEGRSLCVTTSGRICLTPSETRVGDSVAILYGGRTPYILRPIGDDFEFIGESYVHGLMKGEAVEDPNFQKIVRKIRLI